MRKEEILKRAKVTVKELMEARPKKSYNKKVRVLDYTSNAYLGQWFENEDKIVKDFKITSKYIFIWV